MACSCSQILIIYPSAQAEELRAESSYAHSPSSTPSRPQKSIVLTNKASVLLCLHHHDFIKLHRSFENLPEKLTDMNIKQFSSSTDIIKQLYSPQSSKPWLKAFPLRCLPALSSCITHLPLPNQALPLGDAAESLSSNLSLTLLQRHSALPCQQVTLGFGNPAGVFHGGS